MKEFTYVIKDPAGIHARPAGILVKQANTFKSNITAIISPELRYLKRIFSIMALGAKQGDTIILQIEGSDEEQAAIAIEECLKANF